jgi:hypothetical protein
VLFFHPPIATATRGAIHFERAMMATLKNTVDAITRNCVIYHRVIQQAARQLREDGLLPSSRGSVSAHLTPRHVALLLLASLTASSASAASRSALAYGNLVHLGRNGVDLEPGETQRTLVDELEFFIGYIWRNTGLPHHPFTSMTLDLTHPAASIKVCETTPAGELCENLVFIEPGDDPDKWAAQRIRTEVTLPGSVFFRLADDLKKLQPVNRAVTPRMAKRWAA